MKRLACLAFLALLLPGCDETDAVAVRLRVAEDLSGTLTTSALEMPAGGGQVGDHSQGVDWNARVSLACNAGSFTKLSDVHVFDIALTGQANPGGLSYVHITLPRGEQAQWARALVPLTPDERARSAKALDPSGRTAELGATIKIEVTLPANIVGNGLQGRTRGVKVTTDGPVATVIVPLATALSAGDPLIWHLTWEQK